MHADMIQVTNIVATTSENVAYEQTSANVISTENVAYKQTSKMALATNNAAYGHCWVPHHDKPPHEPGITPPPQETEVMEHEEDYA